MRSECLTWWGFTKDPFSDARDSDFIVWTRNLRSIADKLKQVLSTDTRSLTALIISGREGLGQPTSTWAALEQTGTLWVHVAGWADSRSFAKLRGSLDHPQMLLWGISIAALSKLGINPHSAGDPTATLFKALDETGKRLFVVTEHPGQSEMPGLNHLLQLIEEQGTAPKELFTFVLVQPTDFLSPTDKSSLEQFHCSADDPLDDIADYVETRLRAAGVPWQKAGIFGQFYADLHHMTKGYPNRLNDLCTKALELAADSKDREINLATLFQAAQDLRLPT